MDTLPLAPISIWTGVWFWVLWGAVAVILVALFIGWGLPPRYGHRFRSLSVASRRRGGAENAPSNGSSIRSGPPGKARPGRGYRFLKSYWTWIATVMGVAALVLAIWVDAAWWWLVVGSAVALLVIFFSEGYDWPRAA
jgi:hypothetical protein